MKIAFDVPTNNVKLLFHEVDIVIVLPCFSKERL